MATEVDAASPYLYPYSMTTATVITLADINRKQIAKATNTDIAWVSRIFSTAEKHQRFVGSVPKAKEIATYLGLSLDEFLAFLRLECGKEV